MQVDFSLAPQTQHHGLERFPSIPSGPEFHRVLTRALLTSPTTMTREWKQKLQRCLIRLFLIYTYPIARTESLDDDPAGIWRQMENWEVVDDAIEYETQSVAPSAAYTAKPNEPLQLFLGATDVAGNSSGTDGLGNTYLYDEIEHEGGGQCCLLTRYVAMGKEKGKQGERRFEVHGEMAGLGVRGVGVRRMGVRSAGR